MKVEELHVSSLIVHVKPEKSSSITNSINALKGAEMVTITEQGKAIVIIEAANQGQIMQCIDQINELDGVLHTGLVYHEFEKSTQNDSEEIQ
ncbi:sorbose reductase [Psychromonas sp. RZ22]|uniref:chaperone NapD n=1 Tax=Psychromonas algarum TaxID=2555643 RepID=UPI0010684AF2|nr:chaperone NapD [Psychromonas sp. RZ22]TEW56074.1 sorbose reductase [Psychromonas sp. RZ22]